MTEALKVLGQVATAATTDTTLYTVPASTEAVLSSLVAANRSATPAVIRVAVRPNGEAIANKHYIAYDLALAANAVEAFKLGITLDAADVVTVRASTADVSWSAFGSEIS